MLEAIFTSKIDEIKVSGLTQWDKGQVISVTCPDITELFQVHFAFKGGKEALVVTAADTKFAIPDELLMQPKDLVAYVYAVSSDGSGETVKTIHLPITPRAMPKDYTSDLTPSQMEQLESMLAEFYEDATVKAATALDNVNNHIANKSNPHGVNLAQVGGSNPNLLDNWYFVDPINQRGATEYTTEGYTIDRWKKLAADGVVVVSSDGIYITGGDTAYTDAIQWIENFRWLVGKTATLSVLTPDNNLYQVTRVIPELGSSVTSLMYFPTLNGGVWLRGSTTGIYAMIRGNAGVTQGYKAIKLELGSVQTLAHQDTDGNWVLNDPPPNKMLELAKCQRYFQNLTSKLGALEIGHGYFGSATQAYVMVPVPVSMRAKPAVVFGGTSIIDLTTYGSKTITACSVYGYSDNEIVLAFTGTGFTKGNVAAIRVNTTTDTLILDANL